jgi:hypothetical protein
MPRSTHKGRGLRRLKVGELDTLLEVSGRLLAARNLLNSTGARKTKVFLRRAIGSLDGAIRHASRCEKHQAATDPQLLLRFVEPPAEAQEELPVDL